jgi:hypothetical protein
LSANKASIPLPKLIDRAVTWINDVAIEVPAATTPCPTAAALLLPVGVEESK